MSGFRTNRWRLTLVVNSPSLDSWNVMISRHPIGGFLLSAVGGTVIGNNSPIYLSPVAIVSCWDVEIALAGTGTSGVTPDNNLNIKRSILFGNDVPHTTGTAVIELIQTPFSPRTFVTVMSTGIGTITVEAI